MNFKKFVSCVLISIQCSMTSVVFADDVSKKVVTNIEVPKLVLGETDIGAVISPMRKGQFAAFTGVLMSPKAVATIVAQLNSLQDQIKIEIDRVKGEEKAKFDFRVSETTVRLETDKKILQAQIDEQQNRINVFNDQMKKQESEKQNVSLWTGIGVGTGFVVGVSLSALTFYAINHTSK